MSDAFENNGCSCKKGYTCVMCTMELMDEEISLDDN